MTNPDCMFVYEYLKQNSLIDKSIFCIYSFHHTICAQLLYAFREAIAEIIEVDFEVFKQHHFDCAQRLHEGLQNIGLELFVENSTERLPSVTSVRIPHGVRIENVMTYMMQRYVLSFIFFGFRFECFTFMHNVECWKTPPLNLTLFTFFFLFAICYSDTHWKYRKESTLQMEFCLVSVQ